MTNPLIGYKIQVLNNVATPANPIDFNDVPIHFDEVEERKELYKLQLKYEEYEEFAQHHTYATDAEDGTYDAADFGKVVYEYHSTDDFGYESWNEIYVDSDLVVFNELKERYDESDISVRRFLPYLGKPQPPKAEAKLLTPDQWKALSEKEQEGYEEVWQTLHVIGNNSEWEDSYFQPENEAGKDWEQFALSEGPNGTRQIYRPKPKPVEEPGETAEQAAKIVLLNISDFAKEYNYIFEYGLPIGEEYFDFRAIQQLDYYASQQTAPLHQQIAELKAEVNKLHGVVTIANNNAKHRGEQIAELKRQLEEAKEMVDEGLTPVYMQGQSDADASLKAVVERLKDCRLLLMQLFGIFYGTGEGEYTCKIDNELHTRIAKAITHDH